MVLRTYAEMTALMRGIQAAVNHYLPDFTVDWGLSHRRLKHGVLVAFTDAYNLRIFITKEYLEEAPYDAIIDTVRHEIGHALVTRKSYASSEHGNEWKAVAAALGARPVAYTLNYPDPTRYIFRSQDGDVYESHKPTKIIPSQDHLPGRYYVKDLITGQKWTVNLR